MGLAAVGWRCIGVAPRWCLRRANQEIRVPWVRGRGGHGMLCPYLQCKQKWSRSALHRDPRWSGSEYFFWAEEGAYGAQVGDAEDPEVLVFTADIAEGKFAIADADAAAGAVV